MPLKIFVKGKVKTNISDIYPRIFHKLIFDILDKDLAKALHNIEVKPFSLYFRVNSKSNDEKNTFFFEINILKDDIANKFISNLFNFSIFQREISYFQNGEKVEFFINPQDIKLKNFLKYEEILAQRKNNKDFLIDIKTPFSFKRYDYDYFLPEPIMVLENLRKKFNRFSNYELEFFEEEKLDILKNFIISGLWGKSKKIDIDNKTKFLGFLGRVLYYYKGENENLKNKIHSLFIFSTFSGLGRKNTMGMGKVDYDYNS